MGSKGERGARAAQALFHHTEADGRGKKSCGGTRRSKQHAAWHSTARAARGSGKCARPWLANASRRGLAVKLRPKARKAHPVRQSKIDPIGSRIMYQSDITQFINQLKEKNPKLEGEQRQGRALLWDKQPIDLDERKTMQDSRVKQTSYVYYQNF
jgi:hypothetical protein